MQRRELTDTSDASDRLSDTAIAAHDRQRALPVELQQTLIDSLCAALQGQGRCLDAGIGTGSLAIPLVAAGIPIVGIDISRDMLNALIGKYGRRIPFPVVQGDLTRLPFRKASFGAALAANIFHLIANWQIAVEELIRVVRPNGLLVVNLGRGGPVSEHSTLVLAQFQRLLGTALPTKREAEGLRDGPEFDAFLSERGAVALPSLEIRFRNIVTVENIIARLEHNPFAWPKGTNRKALHEAANATRAWAQSQFGSVDFAEEHERIITHRLYRLGTEVQQPIPGQTHFTKSWATALESG